MMVIHCIFHAVVFFLAASACPLTDEEKKIATYVQERKQRVSSGDILKQIAAKTYTIDSLSDDMYRWWVQIGLAGQNTAIENFVNLMQKAHQKAQKPDWLSVVLGWLDLILGAAGEEVGVLHQATSAFKNAVATWKTAAGDGDGDFLSMAMKFRSQLPTQETTQLLAVDNFINALREIPSAEQGQGLLAAYGKVTAIIEATVSYRLAFNQYYLQFLKGAKMGDLAFYYSFNAGGYHGGKPKNIIWTTTPSGLDACTVANFVQELNLGCVSTHTPGLEKLTTGAQITVNQGPAVGLQLSCANLDPKSFTGCWVQGRLLPKSNGNCYTVYSQVKGSIFGWPPKEVKDFCANMIQPTSSYTACNYNGYFQGPATCQSDPNLLSCRRASEHSMNSTAALIV